MFSKWGQCMKTIGFLSFHRRFLPTLLDTRANSNTCPDDPHARISMRECLKPIMVAAAKTNVSASILLCYETCTR